jgi:hypothetical protein
MIEYPAKHSFQLSRKFAANYLRVLFDRKELWERRFDRNIPYRNGDWYTIGVALYLDLFSKEQYPEYLKKVIYFNRILEEHFFLLLDEMRLALGSNFLTDVYPSVGLPGFHIFPGFETFSKFFGKIHQDLQWQVLTKLPEFPFKESDMTDHFSFTYVLKAPYLGASLLLVEDGKPYYTFEYEENTLYTHSGQQTHAIAPFKDPVLPGDYRITLQGHGFTANDKKYIYW